ncbi:FadR/GntR family transcriptional regulator [Tropicibacter naphthalenivorans]|uniref:L-lactate utilization operon repressor n=1 Tax=Tropicibacter naphthalenivorans TaxID=441103 RepID=A0A0P1GYC6_9RHOB|nr:FCD domain-containing protein [Tropicibacter naphthalenivorans]CUH81149.1 L-lactate utilization operon repressor [Tropicibacter naphthalenivorans]SMC97410.1 transcriptional regulator, GntR family [Tropicibacter naphthalenivorans]
MPETAASLPEIAMQGIRDLIRTQGLRPGDALPSESALAAHLGVSRPITREALRGLATLRILDIGGSRRARVAMPDAGPLALVLNHATQANSLTIQQILDVRRSLEMRTVSLAALRRSDAQAKDLLDLTAAMLKALQGGHTDLMELDIRFHATIAAASGNPLYAMLVDSLSDITRQTWTIGWHARSTYDNRLENIKCHERIATAILAQNATRAETAMSDHFDSAITTLLRAGVT